MYCLTLCSSDLGTHQVNMTHSFHLIPVVRVTLLQAQTSDELIMLLFCKCVLRCEANLSHKQKIYQPHKRKKSKSYHYHHESTQDFFLLVTLGLRTIIRSSYHQGI